MRTRTLFQYSYFTYKWRQYFLFDFTVNWHDGLAVQFHTFFYFFNQIQASDICRVWFFQLDANSNYVGNEMKKN